MSIYQMSNSSLLTLYARVLENSQRSPIVREAVASYGYDEEAFREGTSLLEAFQRSVSEQTRRYGEQVSATDNLNDAWSALHDRVYMPHVTIARMVFENEGTLRRLGIDGQRPKGFDDWIQEARHFYNTLLDSEELTAQMATRGIGRKKLEAARRDVEALEALDRLQEEAKSEAQEATRRRNDRRRAALDWLADYQTIAQLALVDHPDLGEQLGLRAPS